MEKFEEPKNEVEEEVHGAEILHTMFSPDEYEELEHALRDEGYSINTVEDAFEFSDDWQALENALVDYYYAKNADAKDKAFANIINFIK